MSSRILPREQRAVPSTTLGLSALVLVMEYGRKAIGRHHGKHRETVVMVVSGAFDNCRVSMFGDTRGVERYQLLPCQKKII